jgi:heat shock protein beta
MDIIIRSLYKDRDIFIRELISNSADAIDKYRYQTLSAGNPVNENEFGIRVKYDREAKTLSVTDTGIGMTKEELIKNLGTVAKSGTTDFVEAALKGGKDGKPGINLIGQFGVGFYSVYLVADKVTVVSKHDSDAQHIWQSAADGAFTVAEDPRGNTLPRGTQVILHIKEDATEFLDEDALTKLITRYSQFIAYPISIWAKKTVTEEVPVEEEAPVEKEKEETDDLQVSEDEDEETAKPKTKTVSKEIHEWKVLNTAKPLWTRNAKDITEEEYVEFYKSFTKDTNGYLTKIHFNAEGELSFRSILYIPKTADYNLYDKFYEKSTSLKLYVRKVLISDEFDDFLPRYLNFVKGVVDSDD